MRSKLGVAGVLGVLCLAACSPGGGSGGAGGGQVGPSVGAVRFALSVPGGITIDSASYTVTGPTNVSGTVDLTNSKSSLEFVVGGLLAGDYTITLTATDTAGDRCASSATPFSVKVLQTTQLGLALVCLQGDGGYVVADAGTGSVEIDASVTVVPNPTTLCPTIATFGADNAEFLVGTSTNITTATLPAGASVDYTITSLGGIGMGTLAQSTTGGVFTCTAPGLIQLTVTTSPVPLANDAGVCPPQSMSFFITCEPPVNPCDPGLTFCGGQCINVMTNPDNCGTCGNACPADQNQSCHGGICAVNPCPQGQDRCGGVCIPTQADPTNCGGCGITCDTSVSTCQQGRCGPIPPAGGDIVVINDMNVFDDTAMVNANNPIFGANLVNFTSAAPRAAGTVVLMDYGRNSPCFADGECKPTAQTKLYAAIAGAGLTVTSISSSSGTLTSIDPTVKVVFLWNPEVPYTVDEINTFKRFAADGGRIVFSGEHVGFYGAGGIALENSFLSNMGAQMTNKGDMIDCGYTNLPAGSLRPHEVTAGLTGLRIACASQIIPGPDDFPLFFDTTNTKLLGGVAKISTVPLMTSSVTSALTSSLAAPASTGLNGAGTGLVTQ